MSSTTLVLQLIFFKDDDCPGAKIGKEAEDSDIKNGELGCPGLDTSHMVRRGALVPGKIVDDLDEPEDVTVSVGNQVQY
jgi:hypothetical protein